MATANGRRTRGKMTDTVPRTQTGQRGQPSYAPTAAQREQVTIAAAFGIPHEDIAIGLLISRPTLEKHFAHELTHGAYGKRVEVMQALTKAALNGNVAAAKAILQRVPLLAVPPVPPAGKQAPEEKPAKAPRLGKKEQAMLDARTASNSGTWASLLKPDNARLQ